MTGPCPECGCTLASPAHAVAAALRVDDLDRALELGLLEADPCPGCGAACRMRIATARDARQQALAARERYRARQARLARRAEERAARRADAARSPSALPPAAAAALARATARARKP